PKILRATSGPVPPHPPAGPGPGPGGGPPPGGGPGGGPDAQPGGGGQGVQPAAVAMTGSPYPQSGLWAFPELSVLIGSLEGLFDRSRMTEAIEIVGNDRRQFGAVALGHALGARLF